MSTPRPILLAALLALPVFLSPTGAFSSSRTDAKRPPPVDEIDKIAGLVKDGTRIVITD
jgi:hypothetical protein